MESQADELPQSAKVEFIRDLRMIHFKCSGIGGGAKFTPFHSAMIFR